jgi:hypothetical protein
LRNQLWRVVLCSSLLIGTRNAKGQAPAGSAPPAQDQQTIGATLHTSLDGSAAAGSNVYSWTTTAGYILDKHFSVDVGVPILFVRGTTSAGTTASTSGLGNVFGQLQFADRNAVLNFGAVATVALPTGDSFKGLSTGRVTADVTAQVAKQLSRFMPFFSAGAGNSIFDSRYWQRPYITLGDVAHFAGGTAFNLGRSLTVNASFYDVAPWGNQKVYSRVVAKGVTGGGLTKHGRVFLTSGLTTGSSSIDRDQGFNAGLNFAPVKVVDFEFDYTHSVQFQEAIFSFGVGVNLSSLLRRGEGSGH